MAIDGCVQVQIRIRRQWLVYVLARLAPVLLRLCGSRLGRRVIDCALRYVVIDTRMAGVQTWTRVPTMLVAELAAHAEHEDTEAVRAGAEAVPND